MFLGNHKQKRHINLGNATTYSAKELVERNKRAREERSRMEKESKATQVIQRWVSSLLVRKRVFQTLSNEIEPERLLTLYSVFFPFVSVQQWILALSTGCRPSQHLLRRLCRIADRSNELGALLWQFMKQEHIVDFQFLRSCILKYPDQRRDILDFATSSCLESVNEYIEFILVLPGGCPPHSILPQVLKTIQTRNLSDEDQKTLFLNCLRVSPPFLPLLSWGLEHINVFQVYNIQTLEEDEHMPEDHVSVPERELVDRVGTTDMLRTILQIDSAWDNLVTAIGLILFRYGSPT
jgi:hypothetical protein